MSKYKILVYPNGDKTGCFKYRVLDPHVKLQELSKDFWVEINYEPNWEDIGYLKQFNMVFFHRALDPQIEKTLLILDKLHLMGIKTMMDLDDWVPGPDHPLYHIVKMQKIDKHLIEIAKKVNYISVATPALLNKFKTYNKNVFHFPNSINFNEKQFNPNPTQSERIRFGCVMGSSHLKDIQILNGFTTRMNEFKDKIQLVLAGYDVRGQKIMIDPTTNQTKAVPIKPEESVWYEYEKIFTNKYEFLTNQKYIDFLKTFKNEDYISNDVEYRRIWTKPITSYGTAYNELDVLMVPLVENEFNYYKSNLKLLEAGAHKKAVIVQNYEPYVHDIKHGENCLVVDSKKNHKDWNKHIKTLVNNPDLIKELGENLHKHVKENYSLEKTTSYREEVYKQILN